MLNVTIFSNPTLETGYDRFRHEFQLTSRELEILKIMTYHGLTNKELAEQLKISEKTVKNHIASIHTKTSTNSTRKLQAMIFYDTLLPLLSNVFQSNEKAQERSI